MQNKFMKHLAKWLLLILKPQWENHEFHVIWLIEIHYENISINHFHYRARDGAENVLLHNNSKILLHKVLSAPPFGRSWTQLIGSPYYQTRFLINLKIFHISTPLIFSMLVEEVNELSLNNVILHLIVAENFDINNHLISEQTRQSLFLTASNVVRAVLRRWKLLLLLFLFLLFLWILDTFKMKARIDKNWQ